MRIARSLPWGGSLSGGLYPRGGFCLGCLCQGDTAQKEHGTRDNAPWKEHETRQPDRKWHHIETPSTPLPWWTEWLAHACENITLPQTSFAGGKYKQFWIAV